MSTKKIIWIGAVLISLIAGYFFLTNWICDRLEGYLTESIAYKTKGEYNINFEHFHLNLISRTLEIKDIHIFPTQIDTTLRDSLTPGESKVSFELRVPKLSIINLGVLPALTKKELTLDSLVIDNPQLRMRHAFVPSDTIKTKANRARIKYNKLFALMPGSSKAIRVRGIRVNEFSMVLVNEVTHHPDTVFIEGFNLALKKLLIDKEVIQNDDLLLPVKAIEASLKSFKWVFPTDQMEFKLDGFELSSKRSFISLDSLRLSPLVSPAVFANKNNYQTTCHAAKTKEIKITGVNFKKILQGQKLHAGKLTFQDLSFYAYLDKSLPFPQWRRPPLPQAALQEVDLVFFLDTLQIKNGHLMYEELAPQATEPGRIIFGRLNGIITSITNDDSKLDKGLVTRAKISGYLMGKSKMDVEVAFNLGDEQHSHTVTGSMGNFDIKHLNPMVSPIAPITVNSGMLDDISFRFEANKTSSSGEVTFLYRDLNISFKDKKTKDTQQFDEKLKALLANALLIKSSNPDKPGENPRVGKIAFDREVTKGIIAFWWSSLFTGLKASATPLGKKIEEKAESRKERRAKRKTEKGS